jgi:glycerol uptake facilitator-like aquaporin
MQNHLSARLLAEFIGTFAFVFIGAGAAAVVGTGPDSMVSPRLPSPTA